MKLIETKTLGTAAASVEFTSIPQTFTDLVIVASVRNSGSGASNNLFFRFNGQDANRSYKMLYGSGTSALSTSDTKLEFGQIPASGATANTFSNGEAYVSNYSGSQNKSMSIMNVRENNIAASFLGMTAGLWTNTAAITSVLFTVNGDNLVAGSTISLYGILKGSDGITTAS
jgi:hypothetical protein